MQEVFRGQARFLGKSARRQVIGIAPGRYLADLDQPFAHAALQISVGKAKRYSELVRHCALGDVTVTLDHVKNTENDLVLGRFAPLALYADGRHRPPLWLPPTPDVHAMNVPARLIGSAFTP